jgi:hypothetical protein
MDGADNWSANGKKSDHLWQKTGSQRTRAPLHETHLIPWRATIIAPERLAIGRQAKPLADANINLSAPDSKQASNRGWIEVFATTNQTGTHESFRFLNNEMLLERRLNG